MPEPLESPHKRDKLKRAARGAVTTLITAGAAAAVIHVSGKDKPERLSPTDISAVSENVSWDEDTRAAVEQAAQEFSAQYEVAGESAKNKRERMLRFKKFLATYAPDIRIVYMGEEKTRGMRLLAMTREPYLRALGRSNTPPHYFGKNIFYPRESGISGLLVELPHMINADYEMRRYAKYASDLAKARLDQIKTYGDLYALEYQAHALTEPVIRGYLALLAKGNPEVSFSQLYNIAFGYYQELTEEQRSYESSVDIKILLSRLIGSARSFPVHFANASPHVLANIRTYRQILDGTSLKNEQKALVFKKMVVGFQFDDQDMNVPIESYLAQLIAIETGKEK